MTFDPMPLTQEVLVASRVVPLNAVSTQSYLPLESCLKLFNDLIDGKLANRWRGGNSCPIIYGLRGWLVGTKSELRFDRHLILSFRHAHFLACDAIGLMQEETKPPRPKCGTDSMRKRATTA